MSDNQPRSPTKQTNSPKIQETLKRAREGQRKRLNKQGIEKYSYHIVIGGFVLICSIALFSILFSDSRKLSQISVLEDEFIEKYNNDPEISFKLGKNEFFQDWMLSDAKKIINNRLSNKPTMQRCPTMEDSSIIPERFNFREKYPECVKPLQNQGNCSSSYTVAAVSASEDRFCAMTKGKINVKLSAQQALSCDRNRNEGCKGGSVSTVLDYGRRDGFVDETCLPYSADSELTCPTGITQCQKFFLTEHCLTGGEEGIKREIYKNGPVVAVIPVYRDFLLYKSGIYNINEGTSKFQGGHALKVVGWDKDEETGIDYWIVENWWGESWGIKGLGHIQTGQKDLYLDEFGVAPMPSYDKEKPEEGAAGEGSASTEQKTQESTQTTTDLPKEDAEQIE